MTQENQTNRRLSPRELFEEEGVLLEVKGVEYLVCVAESIESVQTFADSRSLKLAQSVSGHYINEYVLYKEEDTYGEVVSFVIALEKGPSVWVTNTHQMRFSETLDDLQTFINAAREREGTVG